MLHAVRQENLYLHSGKLAISDTAIILYVQFIFAVRKCSSQEQRFINFGSPPPPWNNTCHALDT